MNFLFFGTSYLLSAGTFLLGNSRDFLLNALVNHVVNLNLTPLHTSIHLHCGVLSHIPSAGYVDFHWIPQPLFYGGSKASKVF